MHTNASGASTSVAALRPPWHYRRLDDLAPAGDPSSVDWGTRTSKADPSGEGILTIWDAGVDGTRSRWAKETETSVSSSRRSGVSTGSCSTTGATGALADGQRRRRVGDTGHCINRYRRVDDRESPPTDAPRPETRER